MVAILKQVTEASANPPDVDALVKELREKVAKRFAAGEYPPDLERELREHFEEVASAGRVPDRFADVMRQIDDAAGFSPHRIPLVSSLPGGSRLHGLIGAVVRRQISGVLAQNRQFAMAVRDVLTRVVQALPENSDASSWWELPEAYMEELYGPRASVVRELAPLVAELAGARRVLVLETGRGELHSALSSTGVRLETGAGKPLDELDTLAEAELDGIAVRRVLERLASPELATFARLAARKLRPGGVLAVEIRSRQAQPDPALPHVVDPDFLAFMVRDAGFQQVRSDVLPEAIRVIAHL